MVIGEIKRFMRDDGLIKVSRSLKTLNNEINKFINQYKNENNGEIPSDLMSKLRETNWKENR